MIVQANIDVPALIDKFLLIKRYPILICFGPIIIIQRSHPHAYCLLTIRIHPFPGMIAILLRIAFIPLVLLHERAQIHCFRVNPSFQIGVDLACFAVDQKVVEIDKL